MLLLTPVVTVQLKSPGKRHNAMYNKYYCKSAKCAKILSSLSDRLFFKMIGNDGIVMPLKFRRSRFLDKCDKWQALHQPFRTFSVFSIFMFDMAVFTILRSFDTFDIDVYFCLPK
jgi:hypothetical protein